MVKGVLDSFQDLVSDLQIARLDALLSVDPLHEVFCSLQRLLCLWRVPAIQAEDHVRSSDLLVLLDLLT